MILIDRLVSLSSNDVRTETHLPCTVLQNAEGGNAAWTMEIAAQACAAWIGWSRQENGYQEGRLIKSSSWRLHTQQLPHEGSLETHAKLEAASEMGVFIFQASILVKTSVLAEGQLTILAR